MVSSSSSDVMYSKSGCTKRFDIPLDHLDFKYIDKCSDVKELEKIFKILQSGEEGHYPELTKYCEDRLNSLNPLSRALRKDMPAKSHGEIEREEWAEIDSDLKSWSSDMINLEERLKMNDTCKDISDENLPPVRSGAIIVNGVDSQTSETNPDSSKKSRKRVKPREYREWDKFDIDAELEKVDVKEDKASEPIKTKVDLSEIKRNLDSKDLTESERVVKANREKDKGNEAFKAKDYDEAVIYYSRSISLMPTAASCNNRALAYLKLTNWSLAIDDCNSVLKLEPDNVKALLRRGSAYKGKKDWDRARQDFDRVLAIEPTNKKAEELLGELNAAKHKEESEKMEKKEKGRRMVIEEVDGSDSDTESSGEKKEQVSDSLLESKPVVMEKEDSKTEQNKKSCTNIQRESDEEGGRVDTDNVCNETDVSQDKTENISEDDNRSNNICIEVEEDVDSRSIENRTCNSGKQEEEFKNSQNIMKCEKNRIDSQGELCDNRKDKNETESKSVTDESESETGSENVDTSNQAINESESRNDEQSSVITGGLEMESDDVEVRSRPVLYQLPLPGDVAELKEEGTTFFRSGQYDKAVQKYMEAITILTKDNADHRVNLSLLYSNVAACQLKTGNCSAALKSCTEALELVPHSIKPLLRRASAYEALERYRHAYIDYKHALSIDSTADLGHQGASRCQKMLQLEDGLKWRGKLPSLKRVSHFEVPEIMTCDSVPDQSAVAAAAAAASLPEQSVSNSERVNEKDIVKQVPEKKELSTEEKFEKIKTEGNEHVKQGSFREAIPCYSQCIDLISDRTVSYTNRALCYIRLNEPGDAEKDCTMALGLEGENVKALFRRAQARKMMRKYKESLEDLTLLLKIEPKNSAAKKEMDVVKNYWREELTTMKKQMPTTKKSGKDTASKSSKTRKRMVIEEVEDEEDVIEVKNVSSSSDKSKAKVTEVVSEENKSAKKKVNNMADSEAKENKATKQKSNKSKVKPVKQTGTGLPVAPPTAPNLENATPYEFIQAWNSLKSAKDVKPYADILRQVPPEDLPKVISNKLDGPMLNVIMKCVSQQFINSGDQKYGYRILCSLCKVPRFQTIALFMSEKEKKEVDSILRSLEIQGPDFCKSEDLQKLRQLYSIK